MKCPKCPGLLGQHVSGSLCRSCRLGRATRAVRDATRLLAILACGFALPVQAQLWIWKEVTPTPDGFQDIEGQIEDVEDPRPDPEAPYHPDALLLLDENGEVPYGDLLILENETQWVAELIREGETEATVLYGQVSYELLEGAPCSEEEPANYLESYVFTNVRTTLNLMRLVCGAEPEPEPAPVPALDAGS